MAEREREIWFRCPGCGEESYCGGEFALMRDPDVMCPYCHRRMPLAQVRLDARGEPLPGTVYWDTKM
jgi:hypothetical protein